MKNLVLVTSIIKPPDIPLSYAVRSVFTSEERFEQTKLTIQSIKEKIPDSEIFIVECSDLNENELNYFLQNSHYFLNLYNTEYRDNMHSTSKSLCEGSMTLCALDCILQQNIEFDNLIKISGRYYLSENFNYNNFNNDKIVIKYIDGNTENVFTALFKLPNRDVLTLKNFLNKSIHKMINYVGYEILFAEFVKTQSFPIINIDPIGLKGYVSVSNDFFNG